MDIIMVKNFYSEISNILNSARAKAYNAVNFTMVEAYWNIGRKMY